MDRMIPIYLKELYASGIMTKAEAYTHTYKAIKGQSFFQFTGSS